MKKYMTLQEVTDKIIEELYNRNIKTSVTISDFCKEIGLSFNQEMRHVSQKLKKDGYVKAILFEGGDGLITINSNGIDYIEKKLQSKTLGKIRLDWDKNKINLDKSEIDTKGNNNNKESQKNSKKIPKKTKEEKTNRILSVLFLFIGNPENLLSLFENDIPDYFDDYNEIKSLSKELEDRKLINRNIENDKYTAEITQIGYEYYKNISNNKYTNYDPINLYTNIETYKVEPCFGIENTAFVFANHIDNIDSGQMVGIFGKWGQGKTYFADLMFDVLENKKQETIFPNFPYELKNKYKIIKFNAWKYQETPAIWAYLFETIINEYYKDTSKKWYDCKWKRKFCYTLRHNLVKILIDLIISLIPAILTVLTLILSGNPKCSTIGIGVGVGLGGFALFVLTEISKKYDTAITFIRKYSKKISFSKELGIQAEIEKELVYLLKYWIKPEKNNKLVLFIDDIDRCSDDKMLSLIDSLRTILENDEIQERLIVICAIDDKKLMNAIENDFSKIYKTKDNDNKINLLVKEQMDKLFISGIKLSSIPIDSQLEFVRKIIYKDQNLLGEIKIQQTQMNEDEFQLKEDGKEFEIDTSKRMKMEKEDIYSIFKNIIAEKDYQLTPRQIRVIYYRYRLANNLISTDVNHDLLAKIIFNKSIDSNYPIEQYDNIRQVVDLVVAY